MMVGHAMLAFALAAAAASRRWPAERALAFGAVAGAFATVPDVDMAYALVGLAKVGAGGVWELTAAFWGSSTLVHRAVTHSLVVGAVAATAFAASAADRPLARLAAVPPGAALLAVAAVTSGPLGAAVMALFLLAGVGVAVVAARAAGFGPRTVGVAALVGLLSHPFGDVFTGSPPGFLYPFGVRLLDSRVLLSGDPTLNLLAVFGVELATLWLAAFVYLRLTGQGLYEHVDARAAVGVAYAIAALVLPAPTMDVSYHFVFSVLAVAVVGVAPRLLPSRPILTAEWHEAITWLLTGLGAVTFAALSYTVVYAVA